MINLIVYTDGETIDMDHMSDTLEDAGYMVYIITIKHMSEYEN